MPEIPNPLAEMQKFAANVASTLNAIAPHNVLAAMARGGAGQSKGPIPAPTGLPPLPALQLPANLSAPLGLPPLSFFQGGGKAPAAEIALADDPWGRTRSQQVGYSTTGQSPVF